MKAQAAQATQAAKAKAAKVYAQKYNDSLRCVFFPITKVSLCEHVSAWVYITAPDQSLDARCDFCGQVEWRNNEETDIS